MSSILDAVIQSDNNNAVEQELRSEASSQPRRRLARSSSHPRGPPSVSVGTPGMHSDILGFADDEVVGIRGSRRGPSNPGPRPDVDRVTDAIGETLANAFERFLDEYV